MPTYARPHLSTHTRGHGHSAVAGAAYRLGLNLFDQRTQTWHDFRKRTAGEEVVCALTVAPSGAPDWATDPDHLWNRVEGAEKRKDSQVARDYRVPVPFGLSDTQAAELAERLARFVCERLRTPVSIGLHRDANRDALGELKAATEVGFHAHLYFPTRELECTTGSDGTEEWAFGSKHSLLSNRTTSSEVVEMLNEAWARISNEELTAANLPADRDHRSYERLGINRKPQPKIGQAATAMERRGFFTRRGDLVRDIVVPAKLAEQAHAELLAGQAQQARADVEREGLAISQRPDELALAQERGGEPGATIADRFALALPAKPAERYTPALKLFALTRTVERTLTVLTGLAERIPDAKKRASRASATVLDVRFEIDEATRRRDALRKRADDWRQAHPLRMHWARWMSGKRGMPPRLAAIVSEEEREERIRRDHDRSLRGCVAAADRARLHASGLDEWQSRAFRRLARVLDEFTSIDVNMLPALLELLTAQERGWVEQQLPPLEPEETAPELAEAPAAMATTARLRPRPRL